MAEAARVGVVSSPRHEAWIERALETRMVTMLASETPDIKGILDNYQATGIRTVIVDDDVIGESDEMQDELCKWLKTHSRSSTAWSRIAGSRIFCFAANVGTPSGASTSSARSPRA